MSGLVQPDKIPGPDLDAGLVRGVGVSLTLVADAVDEQTTTAAKGWQVLPTVLAGPGLDVLYPGLAGPFTVLGGVTGRLRTAAAALDVFADAIAELVPLFDAVRADAKAFRAKVDGGVWLPAMRTTYWHAYRVDDPASPSPTAYYQARGIPTRMDGTQVMLRVEWTQDGALVDENNALVSRVNGLYARLEQAEADCANKLNNMLAHSCKAPVEGYTGEQLDAWMQSGDPDAVMPWGGQPYGDRTCIESAGMGVVDFGVGIGEGTGALIGRDPTRGDWSWSTAGQSWLGLATTLGSFSLISNPLTIPLAVMPGPVGELYRDVAKPAVEAGKGLIAWDMWAKDPTRAGTQVVANVATFFIPGVGEVAGGTKAGLETVAATARIAKVAEVAGDAAKIAGKVEHVAGIPARIAGDTLNKLITRFGPTRLNLDQLARETGRATDHTPEPHTPPQPPDHTPGVSHPTEHTPTPDRPPEHTPTNRPAEHTPTTDHPTRHTPTADHPAGHQPSGHDKTPAREASRPSEHPTGQTSASSASAPGLGHDRVGPEHETSAPSAEHSVGDKTAPDAGVQDHVKANPRDITKNDPGNLTAEQQANRATIQKIISGPHVDPAQVAQIQKVLDDPRSLDTTAKKGNFGEMVDDARMEQAGYTRLGPDRITSLDQTGHHGIDAIYYKAGDPSSYVVVDQKYATGGSYKLKDTVSSGQEMSPRWIKDRLQDYFNPAGRGVRSDEKAYLDDLISHYGGEPIPANVSSRVDVLDGNWDVREVLLNNNFAQPGVATKASG